VLESVLARRRGARGRPPQNKRGSAW